MDNGFLQGSDSWTAICSLDQLIEHTFVCARLGQQDLLLIWDDGRPIACERTCPHENADLSRGQLSAGRLRCPRHAASFDLSDGAISAGWPSRNLRIYP